MLTQYYKTILYVGAAVRKTDMRQELTKFLYWQQASEFFAFQISATWNSICLIGMNSWTFKIERITRFRGEILRILFLMHSVQKSLAFWIPNSDDTHLCWGWTVKPPRILPVAAVFTLTFVCLLTFMHLIRCSPVVHGQGEGRGAVAPQADRTEAGETHGKSCHLKDTRQEDYVFLGGTFKVAWSFSLLLRT